MSNLPTNLTLRNHWESGACPRNIPDGCWLLWTLGGGCPRARGQLWLLFPKSVGARSNRGCLVKFEFQGNKGQFFLVQNMSQIFYETHTKKKKNLHSLPNGFLCIPLHFGTDSWTRTSDSVGTSGGSGKVLLFPAASKDWAIQRSEGGLGEVGPSDPALMSGTDESRLSFGPGLDTFQC